MFATNNTSNIQETKKLPQALQSPQGVRQLTLPETKLRLNLEFGGGASLIGIKDEIFLDASRDRYTLINNDGSGGNLQPRISVLIGNTESPVSFEASLGFNFGRSGLDWNGPQRSDEYLRSERNELCNCLAPQPYDESSRQSYELMHQRRMLLDSTNLLLLGGIDIETENLAIGANAGVNISRYHGSALALTESRDYFYAYEFEDWNSPLPATAQEPEFGPQNIDEHSIGLVLEADFAHKIDIQSPILDQIRIGIRGSSNLNLFYNGLHVYEISMGAFISTVLNIPFDK